eukprot:2344351-Amphidinium_carterae.1
MKTKPLSSPSSSERMTDHLPASSTVAHYVSAPCSPGRVAEPHQLRADEVPGCRLNMRSANTLRVSEPHQFSTDGVPDCRLRMSITCDGAATSARHLCVLCRLGRVSEPHLSSIDEVPDCRLGMSTNVGGLAAATHVFRGHGDVTPLIHPPDARWRFSVPGSVSCASCGMFFGGGGGESRVPYFETIEYSRILKQMQEAVHQLTHAQVRGILRSDTHVYNKVKKALDTKRNQDAATFVLDAGRKLGMSERNVPKSTNPKELPAPKAGEPKPGPLQPEETVGLWKTARNRRLRGKSSRPADTRNEKGDENGNPTSAAARASSAPPSAPTWHVVTPKPIVAPPASITLLGNWSVPIMTRLVPGIDGIALAGSRDEVVAANRRLRRPESKSALLTPTDHRLPDWPCSSICVQLERQQGESKTTLNQLAFMYVCGDTPPVLQDEVRPIRVPGNTSASTTVMLLEITEEIAPTAFWKILNSDPQPRRILQEMKGLLADTDCLAGSLIDMWNHRTIGGSHTLLVRVRSSAVLVWLEQSGQGLFFSRPPKDQAEAYSMIWLPHSDASSLADARTHAAKIGPALCGIAHKDGLYGMRVLKENEAEVRTQLGRDRAQAYRLEGTPAGWLESDVTVHLEAFKWSNASVVSGSRSVRRGIVIWRVQAAGDPPTNSFVVEVDGSLKTVSIGRPTITPKVQKQWGRSSESVPEQELTWARLADQPKLANTLAAYSLPTEPVALYKQAEPEPKRR